MESNEHIEQQAREALDQSVEDISPSVKAKLAQARAKAMQAEEKRQEDSGAFRSWSFTPAAGFGLAAVFSIVLVMSYIDSNDTTESQTLVADAIDGANLLEDLVWLSELEDEDVLIAEDLEFAYWLSEQLEEEGENEADAQAISNT